MFFGWGDPLASVSVAVLVLRVTKSTVHVLMEGTLQNIDMKDVIQTIKKTARIQSIYDLHIWSITSGLNALSSHTDKKI